MSACPLTSNSETYSTVVHEKKRKQSKPPPLTRVYNFKGYRQQLNLKGFLLESRSKLTFASVILGQLVDFLCVLLGPGITCGDGDGILTY